MNIKKVDDKPMVIHTKEKPPDIANDLKQMEEGAEKRLTMRQRHDKL